MGDDVTRGSGAASPGSASAGGSDDAGNRDWTRVGALLRDTRRRAGKTLRETGEQSRLSESFLSQLERGKVSASLSSLQRLTAVLGITVADLFEGASDTEPVRLLRRHERPALTFGKLGRKYLLTPGQQKNLEIFQVSFDVGGSTGDETYSHGSSEEFIFVMSGTFEVEVDGVKHLLGVGDSLLFNSSAQHRAVNVGARPGELFWVISPPSF